MNDSPVIAAGAVCWRIVDGKIRVLLIHRERHNDVSFPKGKVDPGESVTEAAVREIEEEVGLRVVLGAPLGASEYTLPGGREKVVHYWTAEVDDDTLEASTFAPNDEVFHCEWVSVRKARKMLTYAHDREVLDRVSARIDADTLRTFAIIALRHAKAVAPHSFDGPDHERTLQPRGVEQAEISARAIAPYRPEKLISSDAERCLSTMQPLAKLTGLKVKVSHKLSQDAHESGEGDVPLIVRKRLKKRVTAVLCSHGPVLPEIISELCAQTGTRVDSSIRASALLEVASFTVLHFAVENPAAGVIALETHSPGV
jgi:8-oxo-(d)GTP phosphatase